MWTSPFCCCCCCRRRCWFPAVSTFGIVHVVCSSVYHTYCLSSSSSFSLLLLLPKRRAREGSSHTFFFFFACLVRQSKKREKKKKQTRIHAFLFFILYLASFFSSVFFSYCFFLNTINWTPCAFFCCFPFTWLAHFFVFFFLFIFAASALHVCIS